MNLIEHFVERFNTGWTQGKIEDIIPLLHEKVIFVAPDLKTRITGRETCLQTLREYVNNSETKAFDIREQEIHTWEQTTMVSLDYYIRYEMNGKDYKENGSEFWTLNKQNDRWQLVWRAMVKNERIE